MCIPLNLMKLAADNRRNIYLCNQTLHISNMQNHVGVHIIKAHCDIVDLSLKPGKEVSKILFQYFFPAIIIAHRLVMIHVDGVVNTAVRLS